MAASGPSIGFVLFRSPGAVKAAAHVASSLKLLPDEDRVPELTEQF